jgi:hypothetical protein
MKLKGRMNQIPGTGGVMGSLRTNEDMSVNNEKSKQMI